jgi:uncharacterized phage-like protein YoqJ
MILGVTGHRPYRLALRSSQVPLLDAFARDVLTEMAPTKVIIGMQRGWDTACARACAQLTIPFIAAVPWKGFDADWGAEDKAFLVTLLSVAETVKYISPPGQYDPKKLMLRNRWIVDNSNQMLALWDGMDDGGTAAAIRFARTQGVPVTNVWFRWREFQLGASR